MDSPYVVFVEYVLGILVMIPGCIIMRWICLLTLFCTRVPLKIISDTSDNTSEFVVEMKLTGKGRSIVVAKHRPKAATISYPAQHRLTSGQKIGLQIK